VQDPDWIARLLADEDLLRMGHCQRAEDLNLGMGWLYYGLARLVRPRAVVVIGSLRGFAPLLFAKGLADNVEGGTVLFIDPSHVDDFWKDGDRVREYFAGFGVKNIRHFRMTTQQFTTTGTYRELRDVGLVMIDGYHSREQARFDFEAFAGKLSANGLVLFHDSVEVGTTPIYGRDRVYERRVKFFLDELKSRPDLQVLDLPFAKGLSLVRKTGRQS
jgi:predicted O-methyltransferase YrrM